MGVDMLQASDYRHISAWDRMLGSFPNYIRNEQEKALKDDAPLDAVYQDFETNEWVTIGDCVASTQDRIKQYLR